MARNYAKYINRNLKKLLKYIRFTTSYAKKVAEAFNKLYESEKDNNNNFTFDENIAQHTNDIKCAYKNAMSLYEELKEIAQWYKRGINVYDRLRWFHYRYRNTKLPMYKSSSLRITYLHDGVPTGAAAEIKVYLHDENSENQYLVSGISYNDYKNKSVMRNLGRALLPKKLENKFLGSQEDEELLNKYSDSDLPDFDEISKNFRSGFYDTDDVIEFSNLRTNYDIAKAIREYTDIRNANIGQGIVDIGSAAIGGGGAAATKAGVNILKPYVGRKIAQGITQGALGGGLGGAAHGFGTGLVQEDVNPITQGIEEGAIGTATGATFGYGIGKIGQNMALSGIRNNTDDLLRQEQYFDDYINGLLDNSRLGEQSLLQKEFDKLRTAREGLKPEQANFLNNFDINNEFDFDKVIELVKKMRRPKPIEDSLKKEGEIIIMKGSKPFEKGEIDKIITDITSQLTKDEITKGYATRYEGNYTYILYYDKNGKHTMGKFKTNERLYDENR